MFVCERERWREGGREREREGGRKRERKRARERARERESERARERARERQRERFRHPAGIIAKKVTKYKRRHLAQGSTAGEKDLVRCAAGTEILKI